MSESKIFLVLLPDGKLQRWRCSVEELQVDRRLQDSFLAEAILFSPSVAPPPCESFGPTHVSVGNNNSFHFWNVHQLHLNCPWTPDAEGVLTPAFGDRSAPVIPMIWRPVMPVVFGAWLAQEGNTWRVAETYLAAYASNGSAWRLPVANLYAECKLCHGQVITYHPTQSQASAKAALDFTRSSWNSDLYETDAESLKKTRSLFRFRPEGDGFEQLLPVLEEGKDWTSLCYKAACPAINQWMRNA